METPAPENNTPVFPDLIGDNYELWKQYREVHGPEAYRYRRLYEVTARHITNLYKYADEVGIQLPDPGPGAQ